MSLVLLGSLEVISLSLHLPLAGIWTADVEVDAEAVPLGKTSIAFGVEDSPPVVFTGSVIEQSGFLGRARAFVIGGTGGLHRMLPPRQYQLAPPHLIVTGILRETGEQMGDLSTLANLSPLPKWIRSAGSGAHGLRVLGEHRGFSWRVVRDGSVRVGPEKWPKYSGAALWIEENLGRRRILTARDGPDIEPGVVIDGQRVGRVVHRVKEGGIFRSEIHFMEDPCVSSLVHACQCRLNTSRSTTRSS
jgi:hypothetical protein